MTEQRGSNSSKFPINWSAAVGAPCTGLDWLGALVGGADEVAGVEVEVSWSLYNKSKISSCNTIIKTAKSRNRMQQKTDTFHYELVGFETHSLPLHN